ncbi:MAG: hypothetical protein R3191_03750, partial [Anaerolineales bacterium]|nr:hypothetical protein [Anaerolineales bacterium]
TDKAETGSSHAGELRLARFFVCDSIDAMKDVQEIYDEMRAAHEARRSGNEGMARVCARRAAGWAIGRRYKEQLPSTATSNAYLLLTWLKEQGEVSKSLRAAADRLTTRITEDHDLPHSEDPLEDAEDIITSMIEKTPE